MVTFERHSSVKSYVFSVHVFSVVFLNLYPVDTKENGPNILQNEDNRQALIFSIYSSFSGLRLRLGITFPAGTRE